MPAVENAGLWSGSTYWLVEVSGAAVNKQ